MPRLFALRWSVAALVVVLIGLLTNTLWTANAQSLPFPAELQVCRAGKEPCQSIIHAPPGTPVSLDLFITGTDADTYDEIRQWKPIAWETHVQLLGDAMPRFPSPLPVMTQGLGKLILEGMVSPATASPGQVPDYLTLQNRYDETRGQLDYSVLALFPEKMRVRHPSVQVTEFPRWLIGRMDLVADKEGRIDLAPNHLNPKPFQAVFAKPDGSRLNLELISDEVLATILVGGSPGQLQLVGQLGNLPGLSFRPTELVATFWQLGAVPKWRQGTARPVAIFSEIVIDPAGSFRIHGLSTAGLPAGTYLVRVKAPNSLGSTPVPITIPASLGGGDESVIEMVWPSLPAGDLDDDNLVGARDVDLLGESFGRRSADSFFNPLADFNADQVVDVEDFSVLADSYSATSP